MDVDDSWIDDGWMDREIGRRGGKAMLKKAIFGVE